MELQRLRYFVALAEELHFSRAAARLYLDQGSLSKAIRNLERELGVRLFDRTSRRVEVSAAGEALLPDARAVLEAAERLGATVRTVRSNTARHALTVGMFVGSHAAAELTGPIVHAFRSNYSDIDLVVRPFDHHDPWGADDADVDVIVSRDPGPPGDIVTPLFAEQKCLVLSDDDELAGLTS